MSFHSIRWRLQAWHGLILATVIAGFGVTAYSLEVAHRMRAIDSMLQRRMSLLASALPPGPPPRLHPPGVARPGEPPPAGTEQTTERAQGPQRSPDESRVVEGPPALSAPSMSSAPREGNPPPALDDVGQPPTSHWFHAPPNVAGIFDRRAANGTYYVIWDRDGRVEAKSDDAPADVPMPSQTEPGPQPVRVRSEAREAILFTPFGACILVGRSLGRDFAELHRLRWWLTLAGTTVVGIGLLGGWWLASHAIQPIERISAAAARIAAGDLSQRIEVAETDSELGRLAAVLNSTFARLDAAFAHERRLSSDVAHELRTPLSVIIAEAQSALARERTSDEYRDALGICHEAARQMTRLTNSLLDLVAFEAAGARLALEPVDLADVAREGVERLRALAGERGLSLVLDVATAPVVADRDRMRQVVANLLANAVEYSEPGGEIRVTTRAEGDEAVIAVADTGIGIAPDALPHVLERFYRADTARARSSEHAGLGLAICDAIVKAHAGRIDVESRLGSGSTFTVRLGLRGSGTE